MNLKDIKDLADGLDEKQANAIMGLIDEKTNNDMEKVLNAINILKEAIIASETKLESKINAQGHRISTLQVLLWGVIVGLIGLVATLIFKH